MKWIFSKRFAAIHLHSLNIDHVTGEMYIPVKTNEIFDETVHGCVNICTEPQSSSSRFRRARPANQFSDVAKMPFEILYER